VWRYATKNCFSNSCKAKRWLCFFNRIKVSKGLLS